MAEKQLYPVFEVPDFVTKKNEESRKQQYKPSVYFDYATGDFRLDILPKIVYHNCCCKG